MAASRRRSITSNQSSGVSSNKRNFKLNRKNSNATMRSSIGSIYDRYGSPDGAPDDDDDIEDGLKVVHFIYSDAVVQALRQMGVFIQIIQTPDPRFRNKKKPKSSSQIEVCKLPQIYTEVRRQVGSREYVVKPREKSQRGSRGSFDNFGYYSSGNSQAVSNAKDFAMTPSWRQKMSPQNLDKRKQSYLPDKKKGLLKLPPLKATKR